MDILHVMIPKGCEPSMVTYNTLIDGLCKKDEIEKSLFLHDIILKGH